MANIIENKWISRGSGMRHRYTKRECRVRFGGDPPGGGPPKDRRPLPPDRRGAFGTALPSPAALTRSFSPNLHVASQKEHAGSLSLSVPLPTDQGTDEAELS